MSYVAAPPMIAYAGQEGRPKPRGLSAYSMWLLGYDTFDIAKHLEISEPVVLRRINRDRSRKRGLPDPYRKAPA